MRTPQGVQEDLDGSVALPLRVCLRILAPGVHLHQRGMLWVGFQDLFGPTDVNVVRQVLTCLQPAADLLLTGCAQRLRVRQVLSPPLVGPPHSGLVLYIVIIRGLAILWFIQVTPLLVILLLGLQGVGRLVPLALRLPQMVLHECRAPHKECPVLDVGLEQLRPDTVPVLGHQLLVAAEDRRLPLATDSCQPGLQLVVLLQGPQLGAGRPHLLLHTVCGMLQDHSVGRDLQKFLLMPHQCRPLHRNLLLQLNQAAVTGLHGLHPPPGRHSALLHPLLLPLPEIRQRLLRLSYKLTGHLLVTCSLLLPLLQVGTLRSRHAVCEVRLLLASLEVVDLGGGRSQRSLNLRPEGHLFGQLAPVALQVLLQLRHLHVSQAVGGAGGACGVRQCYELLPLAKGRLQSIGP
mmetsp:Transcript_42034/g.75202  ORF Transcript_42034/g.75202 Transcript_42034/m.75202 type:complete len:404 (+) Transcript_42034:127-1338(+)